MRRKLFFTVLLTVAVISFVDVADKMPGNGDIQKVMGSPSSYSGRIESIERKNEGYKIEVKLFEAAGSKVLLSYYGIIDDPQDLYKRVIEFNTVMEEPQGRRNPGCFDYRKYLKSCGIWAVADIDSFEIVWSRDLLIYKLERSLMKNKERFIESLPGEARGLTAGILFGDTSLLDEGVYENFRISGTAHVLAVSGLHIGILYGMIGKIMGRRPGKIRLATTAFVLFSAGTLASWSPSVARASGMIGIKTAAEYWDRRYDMVTAMSAVALILILRNPYVIFNTGFQMSFMAALSISFFLPHISKKIPDFAAVMIAASAGLIPYQIYCFNSFSLSSFAANIPVVYLVGVLMPLAALGFCLFCIGIDIEILGQVTAALSSLTEKINEFSALSGSGAIDVKSPPLFVIALLYMTVFFLASESFEIMLLRGQKKRITAVMSLFLISSLLSGILTYCPVGEDDLIFVDVGQGDCIHIRADETDVLIDGGGNINYNVGKNTLKPYLLKNGCSRVDMAVATHLHTDHYRGIEELAEEGMIGEIKSGLTAGTSFEIDENVTLETLWPLKVVEGQDENENCSVFMLSYGGYKILITGDLDEKGEREMMDFYRGTDKLKADILKIGHHGSAGSTCDSFLEAVSPKMCVIQVGKNNYGHPDSKVIEKCRENSIMIFRNDIHGAVGFSFDGQIEYHKMIEEKG